MGTDKALLDFDGRPLIARLVDRLRPEFAEVLVSSNSPRTYAFLGVDVIPDEQPDVGPLGAIVSCLARSSRDLHFVVACDMPGVRMDAVHRLLAIAREQECDAVIPVSAEGLYEPLLAVYRRSVLAPGAGDPGAGREARGGPAARGARGASEGRTRIRDEHQHARGLRTSSCIVARGATNRLLIRTGIGRRDGAFGVETVWVIDLSGEAETGGGSAREPPRGGNHSGPSPRYTPI